MFCGNDSRKVKCVDSDAFEIEGERFELYCRFEDYCWLIAIANACHGLHLCRQSTFALFSRSLVQHPLRESWLALLGLLLPLDSSADPFPSLL